MEPAVQATFDFAKDGALLQPHTSVLTPEATTRDELAWLAYLDALPQVSKKAKLGVDGYCMGGPRVVQASALRPDRVGAEMAATPATAWSAWTELDSPHLGHAQDQGQCSCIAHAQNDGPQREMQKREEPDVADPAREAAYAAAGVLAWGPRGLQGQPRLGRWPDCAVTAEDEARGARGPRCWPPSRKAWPEALAPTGPPLSRQGGRRLLIG